jgi:hypothetical protein
MDPPGGLVALHSSSDRIVCRRSPKNCRPRTSITSAIRSTSAPGPVASSTTLSSSWGGMLSMTK